MIDHWERKLLNHFHCLGNADDASHDLGHFRRVAHAALSIASFEKAAADRVVLLAAAYLHVIVALPKNDPEAYLSSRFAAEKAMDILNEINFRIIGNIAYLLSIRTLGNKTF